MDKKGLRMDRKGPKIVGKKLKKSVLDQKYAPPFYGKIRKLVFETLPKLEMIQLFLCRARQGRGRHNTYIYICFAIYCKIPSSEAFNFVR